GTIATISGRYFSMDRNNKWDRIQKAYDAMTLGKGVFATDPQQALQDWYKKNIDDEMIEPTVITDKKGVPLATVQNNDAIVFYNFRPDRARQLTRAFVMPDFKGFTRARMIKNLKFVTMSEYEKNLPVDVMFPPEYVSNPFGKIIAEAGLSQLRIAETEKYAHVTYFFNGGNEEIYKKEDRVLIPSPKVKTYDEKPEMSAREITKRVCAEIKSKQYNFILANFANADMVGHTGNLKATIKGVETIDQCIGTILKEQELLNGITVITADHGNAEGVIDPITGLVDKEHSTSPVPFIIVDNERKVIKDESLRVVIDANINPIGILADVAPTMCDLLDIAPSPDMTGKSLLADLI
ncbi:MAG: 2,3-bisphosphoglycerate-independent phosphoglycerate mutase, partial [Patescibacteria group bacterium]